MIRISAEIPHRLYTELYPLHDFHFLLAQEILKGEVPEIKPGEVVIVDNGIHELGEPLEIKDILEAARRVQATSAIAPDWLFDLERSHQAAKDMLYDNQDCLTGYVVQGESLRSMIQSWQLAHENPFSPICLPYRANRLALLTMLHRHQFVQDQWYHLLGVRSLREINEIAKMNLPGQWSLDTAKHIKLGLLGRRWEEMDELGVRGLGLLNLETDGHPVPEVDVQLTANMFYNTAMLRRASGGTL